MRALIADDEPLLRAELREALALAWPELQICAEAGDGRAAVAEALAQRPEVVFLDISMPHLDGMAAAQRLREQGYAGEIVFVTAYDQHALAAFDTRAVDYLVKPLEPERLGETVARLKSRLLAPAAAGTQAIAALQQQLLQAIDQRLAHAGPRPSPPAVETAGPASTSPWLRVTRGQHTQLVALQDLACLRAVPGYTLLVTCEGEHLIEQPLKLLQQRLDPRHFLQVHRGTIVNLHFVARIVRERPGHCVVELKHGLGKIEASRSGAELLRGL
jgi:DNA-binding LytR/AlgR family response regulator